MSLPPANIPDNSIENWETRAEQIQTEEMQRKTDIEDAFRETPEFEKLSSVMSEVQDGNALLDTIVMNYGNTESLEKAITKTFEDTPSLTRLGLGMNKQEQTQTVNSLLSELGTEIILEKGEGEDTEKQPPEEMDISGTTTEQLKEEVDTAETPGFPVISRLVDTKIVTLEEYSHINEQLKEEVPAVKAISNSIHDSGRKQEITKILAENESPEKKAEKFYKNMPEGALPKGAEKSEDPIIQLIAENYVEIPGIDGGEANKELDFITAAQEATNQVTHGKQFARSDVFNERINTIKAGGDKIEVYNALKYVYHYVNTVQGVHGKAANKNLRKAKTEKGQILKQKEHTFAEMIQQAKKNAESAQVRMLEKAQEAQKAEISEEITSGDIDFGGGAFDIGSEFSESKNKTA